MRKQQMRRVQVNATSVCMDSSREEKKRERRINAQEELREVNWMYTWGRKEKIGKR